MTNDLKAAAMTAAKELWYHPKPQTQMAAIILREIQPVVEADRKKIERLEKALRWYSKPRHMTSGHTARAALGEEE